MQTFEPFLGKKRFKQIYQYVKLRGSACSAAEPVWPVFGLPIIITDLENLNMLF